MANIEYEIPTFNGIALMDAEKLPYWFIKMPSKLIRYPFPCIYALIRRIKGKDGKPKNELVHLWKAKAENEVKISVIKSDCVKQYKPLYAYAFTSDYSEIDSIFDKLSEVYGDSVLCK